MIVEQFVTKKRSKLLGYLVGRYYVVAHRRTMPTQFTLACFNVITQKFFLKNWGEAVLIGLGNGLKFVSQEARLEYISGFSLVMSVLDLTQTEAERIGLLVPVACAMGDSPDGRHGYGALMLVRYSETQ